jgi:hypothetical protein
VRPPIRGHRSSTEAQAPLIQEVIRYIEVPTEIIRYI